MEKIANPLISFIANYCSSFYIFKNIKMQTELSVNQTVTDFEIRVGMVPRVDSNFKKTTCHLQQQFFNIFEPNKSTKGPEKHSLN
jgi:hypothetical protein